MRPAAVSPKLGRSAISCPSAWSSIPARVETSRRRSHRHLRGNAVAVLWQLGNWQISVGVPPNGRPGTLAGVGDMPDAMLVARLIIAGGDRDLDLSATLRPGAGRRPAGRPPPRQGPFRSGRWRAGGRSSRCICRTMPGYGVASGKRSRWPQRKVDLPSAFGMHCTIAVASTAWPGSTHAVLGAHAGARATGRKAGSRRRGRPRQSTAHYGQRKESAVSRRRALAGLEAKAGRAPMRVAQYLGKCIVENAARSTAPLGRFGTVKRSGSLCLDPQGTPGWVSWLRGPATSVICRHFGPEFQCYPALSRRQQRFESGRGRQ